MPTNLRRMLRLLLKAKHAASTMELRFLKEIAARLPVAAVRFIWGGICRRRTGGR